MDSNKEMKDNRTSPKEVLGSTNTPSDLPDQSIAAPLSSDINIDESDIVEAIMVTEDGDEYSDTVVVDMTGKNYEDLLVDGIDDDLDIVIIEDEEVEEFDLAEEGDDAIHMDNFLLNDDLQDDPMDEVLDI